MTMTWLAIPIASITHQPHGILSQPIRYCFRTYYVKLCFIFNYKSVPVRCHNCTTCVISRHNKYIRHTMREVVVLCFTSALHIQRRYSLIMYFIYLQDICMPLEMFREVTDVCKLSRKLDHLYVGLNEGV